mgnify:CR=1 FL=1
MNDDVRFKKELDSETKQKKRAEAALMWKYRY